MIKKDHHLFPHVLLLLAVSVWGLQWVFVKQIVDFVHPLNIVLGRFLIASLLFLPFAYRFIKKISKKDLIPAAASVLMITAVSNSLGFWATKFTSASEASIILNTNPLFVILLAPFLISEKATNKMRLGIMFGLVGLYFVIFQNTPLTEAFQSQHVTGNLIVLLAAVCTAIGTVFQKSYIKKYGAVTITSLTFISTTLIMAVMSLFAGTISSFPTTGPGLKNIFYIASISTVVPFLFFNYSISRIGVNKPAAYKILIPISTVIFASILLSERLDQTTIIGMILAIIGLTIVQISKIKKYDHL